MFHGNVADVCVRDRVLVGRQVARFRSRNMSADLVNCNSLHSSPRNRQQQAQWLMIGINISYSWSFPPKEEKSGRERCDPRSEVHLEFIGRNWDPVSSGHVVRQVGCDGEDEEEESGV